MKRILATMLCLATASVAMAGEWNFFATAGDGNPPEVIAYDRSAIIKHDGDMGKFCFKKTLNSSPTQKRI